ncbi:hypothetical protein DCC81_02790 [Chitinophaga parva]|uniref:Uncharacterized protein n=1 Tax=Chitinophaga parva TaxID=2169414 RepID=A0A2T7BLB1_9BACT|nr:hypothetical protein [Chitinophaga parva]PUZ28430.1 hypothetical protein DCC81_02790 [Chitinophaga parva]
MKQCGIILMLCLCLGHLAKAQQGLTWKPLDREFQVSISPKQQAWVPFKQTSEVKPAPVAGYIVNEPMADRYYQQCFGFFCKREWELQQKVHIPVKLRLGTYQLTRVQEGY